MKSGIINRKLDLPWMSGEIIEQGTVVYPCYGHTYGCISPEGEAVTKDPNGGYPFFEVPLGSVDWSEE